MYIYMYIYIYIYTWLHLDAEVLVLPPVLTTGLCFCWLLIIVDIQLLQPSALPERKLTIFDHPSQPVRDMSVGNCKPAKGKRSGPQGGLAPSTPPDGAGSPTQLAASAVTTPMTSASPPARAAASPRSPSSYIATASGSESPGADGGAAAAETAGPGPMAAPPSGLSDAGAVAASAPLGGAVAAAATGEAPAAAPTGGIVLDSAFEDLPRRLGFGDRGFAGAHDAHDARDVGHAHDVYAGSINGSSYGSAWESDHEALATEELRRVTQVFGFVKLQPDNLTTDAQHDYLHNVGLVMFKLLGQLHREGDGGSAFFKTLMQYANSIDELDRLANIERSLNVYCANAVGHGATPYKKALAKYLVDCSGAGSRGGAGGVRGGGDHYCKQRQRKARLCGVALDASDSDSGAGHWAARRWPRCGCHPSKKRSRPPGEVLAGRQRGARRRLLPPPLVSTPAPAHHSAFSAINLSSQAFETLHKRRLRMPGVLGAAQPRLHAVLRASAARAAALARPRAVAWRVLTSVLTAVRHGLSVPWRVPGRTPSTRLWRSTSRRGQRCLLWCRAASAIFFTFSFLARGAAGAAPQGGVCGAAGWPHRHQSTREVPHTHAFRAPGCMSSTPQHLARLVQRRRCSVCGAAWLA